MAARPPDKQFTDEEAAKEEEALGRIIFAFSNYGADTEAEIQRWAANYARLHPRHRALLPSVPAKLAAARAAARTNRHFIEALLAAHDEEEGGAAEAAAAAAAAAAGGGGGAGGGGEAPPVGARAVAARIAAAGGQTPPIDVDKVRYVLKNLARDWSEEGAAERAQSYGRIIAELERLFPDRCGAPAQNTLYMHLHRHQQARPLRVLIPGAGLGRLMLDVASLGMEAQGNEFSYFMLLAGSFMLNHTACARQWTVHPWMHSNLNHLCDEDQLRGVAVPDVDPAEVVAPGLLSMCAGDFVDVYSAPEMRGAFDAVATCFFIDTAHNVIEYLEVIHHVLRPGGYWIHLGPLLWHWADGGPDEPSLELPLAEVHRLAGLVGFAPLRQEFVDAAYMANQRAMYKTVYQAAFWTMQRTEGGLPRDLGQLLAHLQVLKQREAAGEQDAGVQAAAVQAGGRQQADTGQRQAGVAPAADAGQQPAQQGGAKEEQ